MSGSSPSPTYTPSQFEQYTASFEGNSLACIFVGVYFTIAGTNLYLLRKKGYKALMLYTVLQLVLTTLYCAMALYTAPATSLSIFNIGESNNLIALSPAPSIVVGVAFVLNTWTSDAFLLYRCYVVCQGNKYALALPVVLYLAAIGSSLAFLVVTSHPGATYSTHAVQVTSISYWSFSVAMNVCASSFISVRLWMHRQAISKVLGPQQGGFYLGYMALTLESALLYTIFAIIALIVFALSSPLELVFVPVLGAIQAIAPSIIIYRIASGKSFVTEQRGTATLNGKITFTSSARERGVIIRRVHEDVPGGSATLLQASASDNGAKREKYGSNSSIHESGFQV